MDMRAGMDTAMAQMLKAFSSINPHCTFLFCNKRGHCIKVLVHDGRGVWLSARRLEQGKFHWAQVHRGETISLSSESITSINTRLALAENWTRASGFHALNQVNSFGYSPKVL